MDSATRQQERSRPQSGQTPAFARLPQLEHVIDAFQQALVLLEKNDYERADEQARRADRLARAAGEKHQLAAVCNLRGMLARYRGDLDGALDHYQQALDLWYALDDAAGVADANHNIGILFAAREHLPQALHHYAQALSIRREIDDFYGQVQTFAVLGAAHRQMGHKDLAMRYLRRALEIAESLEDGSLTAGVYQELAETAAAQGQCEQALDYYRRATAAARSGASLDLRQQIDKLTQEVTQQKRELQLRQQREQDLAVRLQQALLREGKHGDVQTQIVKLVSVQFRSPLSALSNAAYMLERFDGQLPSAKRAANFERVRAAVAQMKQVLDTFTQLNVLSDAIEQQPRPTDLDQLCALIMHEFRDVESRIEFQRAPNNYVLQLDGDLVRQAMGYLVSNALKYSSDQVILRADYEPHRLLLIVRDSGIGIGAGDQSHIYEPFYRGQNVGATAGLGVGLTLANRIVNALDGVLTVRSGGEGEGAEARIYLPCKTVKPIALKPSQDVKI